MALTSNTAAGTDASGRFPELAEVPLVSVYTTVYNHERFVAAAIESVLEQDWPSDKLQYVVIDDGSTDRSAEIVERYADHLTFIRQENQGVDAAVSRVTASLSGDVITSISGDDLWPAGRIARAVEFLREHRDVGLCYGVVELIDDKDEVIFSSMADRWDLPEYEGEITGKLVIQSFIQGGAIAFRGCLKDLVFPVPSYAGWEDWWIAYRLSLVGKIGRIPGIAYRWRRHGNNMSFDVVGKQLARMRIEEQRFRLWMLANTSRKKLDLKDAFAAVERFFFIQKHIVDALGTGPEPVLPPISERDSRRAEEFAGGVESLLACGNAEAAAWLAIRAFALDPSRTRNVELVRAAENACDSPEAQRVQGLRAKFGARSFLVAATLEDLVADPSLLETFARSSANETDATLWVLTATSSGAGGERLRQLLAVLGNDEAAWPNVQLLPDLSDGAIAELTSSADYALAAGGDGQSGIAAELGWLAALVRVAYATDVSLSQ